MDAHDNQDGKKTTNVFDLYGVKRRERRSDDGNPPEEQGYYACGISRTEGYKGQEEWIRMHGEIEGQYSSIDMLRYADIVRIYCPVPELLCIMAEHVVYTLEGHHLDVISMHIQDRMLRALYLFEPERYGAPNTDETVILKMQCEEVGSNDSTASWEEETPSP